MERVVHGGERHGSASSRKRRRSYWDIAVAFITGYALRLPGSLSPVSKIGKGSDSDAPTPMTETSKTPARRAELFNATKQTPARRRVEHFSNAIQSLSELKTRGELSKFACPCCGWHGAEFGPHRGRPNRRCPVCQAFERHRKACAVLGAGRPRQNGPTAAALARDSWLTSPGKGDRANMTFRLVHFGPQRFMEDKLMRVQDLDHVSLDFLVKEYQSTYSSHVLHADVTSIPIPSRFADGVFIIHVLEHISELDKALAELKRILYREGGKKSDDAASTGWLMVEVPCSGALKQTKNCRGKMTKQERIDCAGQWDHVWRYSCDGFAQNLKGAGLNCYTIDGSRPEDFGSASPIMTNCHCVGTPLHVCIP